MAAGADVGDASQLVKAGDFPAARRLVGHRVGSGTGSGKALYSLVRTVAREVGSRSAARCNPGGLFAGLKAVSGVAVRKKIFSDGGTGRGGDGSSKAGRRSAAGWFGAGKSAAGEASRDKLTALGFCADGIAAGEVSKVGRAPAGGTGLRTMSGTFSELRPAASGGAAGAAALPTSSGAISVGVTGAGGITGALPMFATAESRATTGGSFVVVGGITASVAGELVGLASGAGSLVSLAGVRGVATWCRLGLAVEDELSAVLWSGAGLEV